MLRKIIPFVALVGLFAASGAWCVPPPVDFFYQGNVDPEIANSAGPGLSFVNQRDISGAVVYDEDAIDKLAFEINDNGSDSGQRSFYLLQPECGIDQIGATIVGRVKTISSTPGSGNEKCGNLGVVDPITDTPYNYGNSAIIHWGGGTNEVMDIGRDRSATVSGDNTGYHTIRVTIKGRVGGDVAESRTEDFNAYTLDANLSGSGDWEGDSTTELKIDATSDPVQLQNVVMTSSGTYAAVGRAFCVGQDATGKIVCDFKIKGQTTSSSSNMWAVYFLDVEGAELARWYGSASGGKGRVGGSLGTAKAFTGGWDTCRVELQGTSAHFLFKPSTTGVFEEAGTLTTMNKVVGSIAIEHLAASSTGEKVSLDDFVATGGTNVPPDPSSRIVTVYKDENPTPVMTIDYAASVDSIDLLGQVEGFMFGTDNTAAQQLIRFDWVCGSNRGAFAPGEEVAVIGRSLVPTASTQPLATTIDQAKAMPDATSVSLTDEVVTIPYTDNAGSAFFGIEKQDRSAGIRVLWNDAVYAGTKKNINGVLATTADGERVIQAYSAADGNGSGDIPAPLCMNNKATGGAALGAQKAVGAYSGAPRDFDGFNYPNGMLSGNRLWTGTTDTNVLEVIGGVLKFKRYYGPTDTVTNVAYDETATSYKLSFNVKKGSDTGNSGQDFWRVIFKANNGSKQEIGRWDGYWDHVVPQRVDAGVTNSGPSQSLTSSWTKLTMEFTPSKVPDQPDGSYSNLVRFFVNDGATPVWTWTFYVTEATNPPRYPGSITLQNQNRSPNTTCVWLDDFSLVNMTFPFGPDTLCQGLNNVGLLMRIYGKVTATYTDSANPSIDTSYLYLDDGTGILGPNGEKGIKCAAPNILHEFGMDLTMPTVDQDVWVYGILGMQNGERYFQTYDASWVVH